MSAIAALLGAAGAALSEVTDNAEAEAEWLLAAVLGTTRAALKAGVGPAPSAGQKTQFETLVALRASGTPLAYVLAEQPFRGLALSVGPEVLIPRPETEQLVDWALALLPPQGRVLDVCTGSGCVALALAEEARSAEVWASELSPRALRVAEDNGARLGLAVHWLLADGLALPVGTPRFDLMVGNPPYIAEHDPHLPALKHEPLLALVSGPDGLQLIRQLVAQAPNWLKPRGWLLLEHGYDQAEPVQALMRAAGFTEVRSHRDYGGQWRATQGQWLAV